MKFITSPRTLFQSLGLITGISLISLTMISPIAAQSNPNSPNNWPNAEGSDGMRNGLNPFDLIHRSRLGNSRDPQEFSEEQNKNINDQADQFRAKQRELLQKKPSQPTPSSTEIILPTSP